MHRQSAEQPTAGATTSTIRSNTPSSRHGYHNSIHHCHRQQVVHQHAHPAQQRSLLGRRKWPLVSSAPRVAHSTAQHAAAAAPTAAALTHQQHVQSACSCHQGPRQAMTSQPLCTTAVLGRRLLWCVLVVQSLQCLSRSSPGRSGSVPQTRSPSQAAPAAVPMQQQQRQALHRPPARTQQQVRVFLPLAAPP